MTQWFTNPCESFDAVIRSLPAASRGPYVIDSADFIVEYPLEVSDIATSIARQDVG